MWMDLYAAFRGHFKSRDVLVYLLMPHLLGYNRLGPPNSNTVNSMFHFIQIFVKILATFCRGAIINVTLLVSLVLPLAGVVY